MASSLEPARSEPAGAGLVSRPERTWLGSAGLLLAAGAFVAVGGVDGLLAAGLAAGGWYLLAHTYAFALGQIALVAVFSPTDAVPFALVQVGLFGVLFAPAVTGDSGPTTSGATAPTTIAVAALGVLAGAGAAWASGLSAVGLPVAALGVVAGLGFAAYGLHRVQLVSLGLVEGDDEQ